MDYQSLVEKKLIPQGTSGNEVIYACPYCEPGNVGHHLYVNYSKNKWHCLKCKQGGRSINGLLTKLNISLSIDYDSLYNEYAESLDNILTDLKGPQGVAIVKDYSTDLRIINSYYRNHIKPLSDTAIKYLIDRGISMSMIQGMQLAEGINRYDEIIKIGNQEYKGRDYSGRIMIPSLRKDGMISFYLGRDYTGTKKNRYTNAPKELGVASEDVWSLDIITGNTVIICEGVFTAISVNAALGKLIACATYGKSIAEKSSSDIKVTSQGEKLLARNFSNYIMFYDRDAISDAYTNAKYLADRGANVRVVRIPDNLYPNKSKLDANDMTASEVRQVILDSKEFNMLESII